MLKYYIKTCVNVEILKIQKTEKMVATKKLGRILTYFLLIYFSLFFLQKTGRKIHR